MQIYEIFKEGALKGVETVPAKQPVQYRPLAKSLVNRMSQSMGGGPLYKDPFERPEEETAAEPETAADQTAAVSAPVTATTPASTTNPATNYNIPAYQRKGLANPADAVPPATAATEPTATQSQIGVKQINQLIPKIRSRDLNSIKKNIDTVLTKRKPAAPAPSPMSSMASQLTNKPAATSTGGTLSQTPTGVMHKAKPAAVKKTAPVKKTAAKKAPAKKTATTEPKWTGRGKNLTKQQRDYIAAINAKYPERMAESKYANLENLLSQALNSQGYTK